MLTIEAVFTLLAVIWASAFPRQGANCCEFCKKNLAGIAERRALSIILVAVFAVAVRLAVLPVEPIPAPGIHDEFSYLLMADTFAHGRLANPTHPMWIHFETFHVIQIPTYVSIYYPAQGIFLALGQKFLGHPFWGVLLSAALMCGAICWMLQQWVSPGWALLGGFLVALRISTFSYWANSYYGGAVPAIGGALVLGALLRIRTTPRIRDALLLSLGVALLFNSRPYESLFFCIPVAAILLVAIVRSGRPFCEWMFGIIIPASLILVMTLAAMAFYFWRTTGSPIRTPYFVAMAQYFPTGFFPWSGVQPIPQYHHETMKTFYVGFVLDQYDQFIHHPLAVLVARQVQLTVFYFGLVLLVPILALGVVLPSNLKLRDIGSKTRLLLLICACVWFGSQLPIGFVPHYDAMLTAAFYALILLSMRRISDWSPSSRPIGKALVFATVLVCVLLAAVHVLPSPLRIPQPVAGFFTWDAQLDQLRERVNLCRNLRETTGNHLIIVRYSDNHNVHEEWVYNDADIDAAKIVWARDMGAERNRELVDYFAGREVWLLEPDKSSPHLIPYAEPASPSARP